MVSKNQKVIFLVIFIVYILVVLNLTVFRFGFQFDERQLNLTLFADLINIYNNVGMSYQFLRLFLGNILWFVPFGFLLPMLLKRISFLKIIVIGFLFSFTIEASQFIFYKGVAELDDLILNTIGVAIGYSFFLFFNGLISRFKKNIDTDLKIH